MYLLDVSTKQLEWFDDPAAIKFAVISHRWGDREVMFTEIGDPRARTKSGYKKIEGCCTRAQRDGLKYIWIDTCCIDKSDSVQFSEAINSMYKWYHLSHVCYVYLADVRGDEKPDRDNSDFSRSVWFIRGWTLQELLAPRSVLFFAKDWTFLGTRDSLMHRIERITGISSEVLKSNGIRVPRTIAQRMFWAAKRETTRKEDRAYSLLGLFEISMPPIYGEEEKAFERLQIEIMKASEDQSLFAWTLNGDGLSHAPAPNAKTGLLASCPSQYANVHEIPFNDFFKNFVSKIHHEYYRPNFTIINSAVRITLPIKLVQPGGNIYKALLRCSFQRRTQHQHPLVIYLQKVDAHRPQFVRKQTTARLESLDDRDMGGFVLEEVDVVDPNRFATSIPPEPITLTTEASPTSPGDSAAVARVIYQPHGHPPSTKTINIVICGEPGVGTNGVVNLIIGKDNVKPQGDADGCPMTSACYDFSLDNKNIRIFHTVGLKDHQMEIDGYLAAIEHAYKLVQSLSDAGGVHLLLLCMLGTRVMPTVQRNYQLFYEFLCDKKVPMALVITGLGKEKRLEDWWEKNQGNLKGISAGCVGHACITVVRDDAPGHIDKYKDSELAIRCLLRDHTAEDNAFLPDEWFVMLGRKMMSFIPKKRTPGRNDIEMVLKKRCNLEVGPARKIAELIMNHERRG